MDSYRYFIRLAYDGTPWHGWQCQKNAGSVQEELEKALYFVLKKQQVKLTGAGRTDTGVHARNYFAHFDFDRWLNSNDLKNIVYHLNRILPPSIGIYDAFEVRCDTHARFSALSRTYKYYVTRDYNPFLNNYSYRYTLPLNIERMNQAGALMLNHADFTCFTKSGTQTTNNLCKVYKAHWEQMDGMLVYTTCANRFLRNMVRAMVGTMLDVGKDKLSLNEFSAILEKGTRSDAGQSVPACGLFLEDIVYPEGIRLYESQEANQ